MVEKADGSWLPCGDFRRLNLVTEPDSYPLPNMLDFAHVATGYSIFYQICRTPQGGSSDSMPFGLRNAGNTFQRKIDRVKNQLEFCFPYQDDLEGASKEDIPHRLHLRQVFLLLRQHGLIINAEKCVFGAPSIDFLGHRVTSSGNTPLPTFVWRCWTFPAPTWSMSCRGSRAS
jgi:hypothetical protein